MRENSRSIYICSGISIPNSSADLFKIEATILLMSSRSKRREMFSSLRMGTD